MTVPDVDEALARVELSLAGVIEPHTMRAPHAMALTALTIARSPSAEAALTMLSTATPRGGSIVSASWWLTAKVRRLPTHVDAVIDEAADALTALTIADGPTGTPWRDAWIRAALTALQTHGWRDKRLRQRARDTALAQWLSAHDATVAARV